MPLFDRYLFADFSGAGENCAGQPELRLWRSLGNNSPTQVIAIGSPSFSRHSLRDRIVAELAEASRNKERVIFGLDFQFAWPTHLRNFAGINNTPWRKALSTLNHGLNGVPPLEIPIRYCKAFNQFANQDVFWSHTFAHNYNIPNHSLPLPENVRYRITEQILLDKPDLPCADAVGGRGKGSVGGQTICGLHQLALMVGIENVAWWPFDDLDISDDAYKGKHVGVEIYPSIYRAKGWPVNDFTVRDVHDRDAWRSCRYVQHADRPNIPGRLPTVPNLSHIMTLTQWPHLSGNQIRQEGWILGVIP